MGQRVAHPVHPAVLLARGEHLAGGGAQSLVIIGDDQLAPREGPIRQRTQEAVQKGFASEGPVAVANTSRRPSVLTPTAIIKIGVKTLYITPWQPVGEWLLRVLHR